MAEIVELSLFDDAPGLVRRDHPDTSYEAAFAASLGTGKKRRAVYHAIRAAGPEGITDIELQSMLDMDGNTERPRRVELVDAGLVVDSGVRRMLNRRPMILWVATPRPNPA